MFATTLAIGLAIIAGLAEGLVRIVAKVSGVPTFINNSLAFIFACLFIYIPVIIFITGMPVIKPGFWLVIGLASPLLTVAFWLMVEAHRASPMILTAPILAFTPAFMLVTSPLMGVGQLTWLGIAGVIVLTGGLYVLAYEDARKEEAERALKKGGEPPVYDYLMPFKVLWKEKGPRYMLIVAFIFAITANFDYLAWERSNLPFFLLSYHGSTAALGLLAAGLHYRFHPVEYTDVWKKVADQKVSIMLFGGLFGLSVFPMVYAFNFIDEVAYITSGKRVGGIVLAVLAGLTLARTTRFAKKFEGEREALGYRLAGMTIICLAVGLMVFGAK